MLAIRFACVSVTPLGRDVLPEVNCRNATSSGRTSTSVGAAVSVTPLIAPAYVSIVRTRGTLVSSLPRIGRTFASVMMTVQPACRRMWVVLARYASNCPRFIGG